MIRDTLRLNRRSFLTAATGLGLGTIAVGGLAAADGVVRTPTLTIIGEEAGQFALLRTSGAKLGMLAGPPTSKLLAGIVPMLGWTSPVIDVLSISPSALTDATIAWVAVQSHVRSLLILGPSSSSKLPAARSGVQVRAIAAPVTTALAHDVTVDFLPAFSTAAFASQPNEVGAMIAVRRGKQTILLVDEPNVLAQQSWAGHATLVVVPGGDLRQLVATLRPRGIAVNGNKRVPERLVPTDLGSSGEQFALLRTFVNEPAVVSVDDDGLRLPRWARVMAPVATPSS